MGIFRQFPYSNFHDMNMDEIIKICKQLQEEWAATSAEWASYKDFIDNYFNNLDVSNEVSKKIASMAASGELNTLLDPVTVTTVTQWLADHITATAGETVIDSSLTIEDAAADAKAAGDRIRNLENTINDIYWTERFLDVFKQGSINVQTGQGIDSTTRIRSEAGLKIDCDFLEVPNNYKIMLLAYSDDMVGNYLGVWNGTDFVTTGATPWMTKIPINKELGYYYRVVLAYADDSDIAESAGYNLAFTNFTDVILRDSNKIADAKETGDRLLNITESLINKDALIVRKVVTDSINEGMTPGAIDSAGQVANNYRNNSFRTEYYTPLRGCNAVELVFDLLDYSVNYYAYVFFYDYQMNFISRTGGKRTRILAEAPAGAAWMKVSLTQVTTVLWGTNNITNLSIRIGYKNNDKKWYVLGDSISAGYYSLLTSQVPDGITPTVSYDDGTCAIWDQSLRYNYWNIMNDKYIHYNLQDLAYPGQGFFKKASNNQNGIDVINNNSFSDADLVTIAWGFNDWHYNQQRGDHNLIDDTIPYPDQNFNTNLLTTINHAIWYCLGIIAQKASEALIVVQTPLNGWRYGGDFSTKWSINHAMSNSGTLKNIHDDIIYWCDYYNIKYIDLTLNNELINDINIKNVILDGSHPTKKAHEQLAEYVWKMI